MRALVALFVLLALLAFVAPALGAKHSRSIATRKDDFAQEGFVCDVCYFLVGWVEQKLAANHTVEWITTEVGKLCNVFPGFVGTECHLLVSIYVPQIIEVLENKFPPMVVCSKIGLCSALQHIFPAVDVTESKCASCMYFAQWAITSTDYNSEAEAIHDQVVANCDPLTDDQLLRACRDFASSPRLGMMIKRQMPAQAICTTTQSCRIRTAVLRKEQAQKHQDDTIAALAAAYYQAHPFEFNTAMSSTECQLCQWIFSAYESWLSNGQTEAGIAAFLAQLCNFFGSYAAQCEQLVQVYVPKVIQSYVERTTPPILCSSIGLCQLPINSFKAH